MADVFVEHNFRKELLPEMIRRFRPPDRVTPESMDMVTMTEVFEHLLAPVGVMRQVAGMLRPGAVAMGTTGWVDKVEGSPKDWWYLKCLSHATFLSAEGFRRICAEAGCLGTMYPNTALLKGSTGMSKTQCIFAMQKPL
ncbi:MAG: methyltransferase domain-containing protein [Desulfovibrio sp.]